MQEILNGLAQRQLVMVTGKGGVGKSVMTVALGRAIAARGRRVLMLEVDPRENLHPLLGVAPSGGDILKAGDGIYLQNLKPREVADWVVRKQIKIEMLAKRVLKHPVYHRFVDGAPGLREIAILGHALRLVNGDAAKAPAIDTVVLDAPATGHGIYLLTAARLYAEAIGHGPFADLAGDVAAFAADAQRTGVVVVTLAEEMPVQESLELRESLLEKHGHEPELLIVNGVYPEFDGGAESTISNSPDSKELFDLWRHRRAVNVRELERLDAEWPRPFAVVPMVARDPGPPLIRDLLGHLEGKARGARS